MAAREGCGAEGRSRNNNEYSNHAATLIESVDRNIEIWEGNHPMLTQAKTTRRGFTLIELLVTISIIAILASLAAWGTMRAYIRAQEFRIEDENSQIAAALESFKTAYGFYPPNPGTLNEFIPYLNRVSPNHGEFAIVSGTTRRIDIWWTNVGQYLNAETSLTFWLSGIAKNKQFPLTWVDDNDTPGTAADDTVRALTGYNGPVFKGTGTQVNVERDVRYEFKQLLKWRTSAAIANVSTASSATPEFVGTAGTAVAYPNVAVASQTSGRYEPYVYFLTSGLPSPLANNASTTLQTSTNVPKRDVYLVQGLVTVGPYWFFDTSLSIPSNVYYAKEKFQLYSPGIDGIFSATDHTSGNLNAAASLRFERDNLANFTEGRLEKLILQ